MTLVITSGFNHISDYSYKFFKHIIVPENMDIKFKRLPSMYYPQNFSDLKLDVYRNVILIPNFFDFSESEPMSGFLDFCFKEEHPNRTVIFADKNKKYQGKSWENHGANCYGISHNFNKEECQKLFNKLISENRI